MAFVFLNGNVVKDNDNFKYFENDERDTNKVHQHSIQTIFFYLNFVLVFTELF